MGVASGEPRTFPATAMSTGTAAGRVVFVTGATGYLGRHLIPRLLDRGHRVLGLVRPESEARLPTGCAAVVGNPLEPASFESKVPTGATLVHLVGVPHPAPWKGAQFRAVDLVSVRAALVAARGAAVTHFVYISVAHPAPVMKSYIQVREECEAMIRRSGLAATILRPWYVTGPGRRWPLVVLPVYRVLERMPATRAAALRLGLVTIEHLVHALLWAIESPPAGVRVLDVPAIRGLSQG